MSKNYISYNNHFVEISIQLCMHIKLNPSYIIIVLALCLMLSLSQIYAGILDLGLAPYNLVKFNTKYFVYPPIS